MGKARDFISLELRDGRVFFQYDLGGMPAKLMTNKTYNASNLYPFDITLVSLFLKCTIDLTIIKYKLNDNIYIVVLKIPFIFNVLSL
jgi:hypothetical protein